MVQKLESMDISLQPFVQGKGHPRRSLCWDMLTRQWSIAICVSLASTLPQCVPNVYIWCTAFGPTPGEVAAICVHSPKLRLSSPQTAWKAGHKQLTVPLTLPRRQVTRWGDGMAESQTAVWNTTCSRGFHRDLGDNTPFDCCLWRQDFHGALGENMPFPLSEMT